MRIGGAVLAGNAMPRRAVAVIAAVLVCLLGGTVRAGGIVHFDRSQYDVLPGQVFQAQLLLDMDTNTAGDQVPAAGLFSMGAQVSYAPASAQVAGPDSILLPAALNGNGIGGPPYKTAGAGVAGFAGALDLSATEGYKGALLGTISIQDLAVGTSSYALNLSKYFPTKANFVDFEGNTLDSALTFGTATVNVLPLSRVEDINLFPIGLGSIGGAQVFFHWRGKDLFTLDETNTKYPWQLNVKYGVKIVETTTHSVLFDSDLNDVTYLMPSRGVADPNGEYEMDGMLFYPGDFTVTQDHYPVTVTIEDRGFVQGTGDLDPDYAHFYATSQEFDVWREAGSGALQVARVPEPASLGLMGLGAVGVWGAFLRRQRNRGA